MAKLDKLIIVFMALFVGSRIAFCIYILLEDNTLFQILGVMILLPLLLTLFFAFIHTKMANKEF